MTAKTAAATPKALGYRMPAEWEPHEAIWLSWPHDPKSFGPGLPMVERSYASLIKEIHKTERVELFVTDPEMQKRASALIAKAGADLSRVRFHGFPYADVWIRDYGPTFVVRKKGEPKVAIVRWIFNAWGGKYEELKGDARVPGAMFPRPPKTFEPGVVMEGGSIEVNGSGTVLTTEQCLLNKNRNPGFSRAQIEDVLRANLGVSNVLWLGEGIAGDDTDGHIDDIARFYGKHRVLCAVEHDKSDANFAPLKDCVEVLSKMKAEDGKPIELVELPMPEPVEAGGRRLPASYANFYIGNNVVLAPVFDCPSDDKALQVLEKAFPGRRIAPIPCREWVRGLGTVHCGSQQQPKA